ncbi:MAG TPA: hypothetical protein VGI10_01900 [Polyangiaceae bacterium]|jgi:hypothetical protein
MNALRHSLAACAAWLRALKERARRDPVAFTLATIGLVIVAVMVGRVVAPLFADLSAMGGHDWDEHSAHRYLAVKSLREFGQFPFWNPYTCGGFSDWANVQGGVNIVSPWFPVYLLAKLRYALRVEVIGMAAISALGTWLLAGEFTKSAALRTLACVVFVVNGRWALQAATGHTWHLYYAWVPWTFWFFERTLRFTRTKCKVWNILGGGASIALMIYEGGIYPFPHTVVLLGLYAFARAVHGRSLEPLTVAALFFATAFGLAGPKLLPTMADFPNHPRLTESTEAIDLTAFVQALVAREQVPGAHPAHIPRWGWHEYGMYIGWAAFLLLAMASSLAQSGRERALRFAGLWAVLLSFGAFHEYAPWTLLHQVSIFRSQHVPSRWLYPAALLLGLVACAVGERYLVRSGRFRRRLEFVLLLPALWLAVDVSREANRPMQHAFWMKEPDVSKVDVFYTEQKVPRFLQYAKRDYAPEALPAMQAGIGVIECTMHAGLNIWAEKDARGRTPGLGARGRGAPDYRGEAFMLAGEGKAQITRFTPNEMVVHVSGARAGDTLVLNQNFDAGWRVNGQSVLNHEDSLATVLQSSEGDYRFRFYPRWLWPGCLLFVLTLGVFIWLLRILGRPPASPTVLHELEAKPPPSTGASESEPAPPASNA